eukprot:135901_1
MQVHQRFIDTKRMMKMFDSQNIRDIFKFLNDILRGSHQICAIWDISPEVVALLSQNMIHSESGILRNRSLELNQPLCSIALSTAHFEEETEFPLVVIRAVLACKLPIGSTLMDPQDMTTSYPLDKIRILLLEGIAQSAVDDLVKAGYTVETTHRLTPEELKLRIADFHVVGIRSKTRLTTEVLKSAKKLLCVGHFCIGTDQTDLEYARKVGIPVFNSPFANTRSVAELVLGEMIMLARQVPDRSAEVHRGVWNKVSRQCHEIRGKSLGIIGYGHVGQQLSVLAEAAGMRVRYVDIEPKLSIGNASASMELDEMLRESDFVSLHVPMTELTKNMISKEQIAMMKPCSYLINASRGKVVDVEATAAALKSGHLAGAAFDVYPQEPGSKTDEFRVALQGCRNTILTPHIGGSTEEAQHQI